MAGPRGVIVVIPVTCDTKGLLREAASRKFGERPRPREEADSSLYEA